MYQKASPPPQPGLVWCRDAAGLGALISKRGVVFGAGACTALHRVWLHVQLSTLYLPQDQACCLGGLPPPPPSFLLLICSTLLPLLLPNTPQSHWSTPPLTNNTRPSQVTPVPHKQHPPLTSNTPITAHLAAMSAAVQTITPLQ